MPLSIQQFIDSLTTLNVLPPGELSGIRDKLTEPQLQADAETLAKDLVRSGKLTKYQAAALYKGRGKGLAIRRVRRARQASAPAAWGRSSRPGIGG